MVISADNFPIYIFCRGTWFACPPYLAQTRIQEICSDAIFRVRLCKFLLQNIQNTVGTQSIVSVAFLMFSDRQKLASTPSKANHATQSHSHRHQRLRQRYLCTPLTPAYSRYRQS